MHYSDLVVLQISIFACLFIGIPGHFKGHSACSKRFVERDMGQNALQRPLVIMTLFIRFGGCA